MNEISDHDRADIERVRADEKKLTMLHALKTRIKSHQDGFRQATARIEACQALVTRSPLERPYLEATIDTWIRIRNYHDRACQETRRIGDELAAQIPHGTEMGGLTWP